MLAAMLAPWATNAEDLQLLNYGMDPENDTIIHSADTSSVNDCWPLPIMIGNESTYSTALPINDSYSYSLTETIIDSAEIGGVGTIIGIKYYYSHQIALTTKTNCTIYLQPTTKTTFTNSSDLELLDTTIAVKVFEGAFRCTQGWNTFYFDTVYHYSGTGNLMIIVDDNSDNFTGISNSFSYNMCTGLKTISWYDYSQNPDPTNNTFSGNKSCYNFRATMTLVACDTAVCHTPLYAEETVGANTAVVTWSSSNASSYSVTVMSDTSTVSYSTTTDTTITLTGLTPNSEYTIAIRALCSVSDSSAPKNISFRTECGTLTATDLPYTEDFESYENGHNATISPCWFKATNSSINYPCPTSTNAITGNRSLLFFGQRYPSGTITFYSYAALPELDSSVDVSSLTVTFNARRYLGMTNYFAVIQVGVMTNPTDVSTFVAIDSIDLTSLPISTIQNCRVHLSNYAGTAKYVAFYCPPMDSGTYTYFLIDDVVLDFNPGCQPVSQLIAFDAAPDSITVSWTDTENGDVTYSTFIDTIIVDSAIIGTTYTFTGLTPNTDYILGVKANCSSTEASPVSTIVAHTECVAITAADLPYFENFDTYTSSIDNPATGVQVPCWTLAHQYVLSESVRPQIYYGRGHAHSGDYSLYLLYQCTYAMPRINAEISQLQMHFWLFQPYHFDRLIVGVMSDLDDTATFVPIDTIGNISSVMVERTVNFSSYSGNGHYIAFRNFEYNSPYSATSFNFIDDITIDFAPACIPVSHLEASFATDSSVTLVWSDNNNTGITYSAYVDGIVVDSNITTNTYTVAGLSAETFYTFGVKSHCSVSHSSPIFTTRACTRCSSIDLPFVESFEDTSASRNCWTYYFLDDNSISFVTSNGRSALRFRSYDITGSHLKLAFSPVFNMPTTGDSLHVRVRYSTFDTINRLYVGYVTTTDTVLNTQHYSDFYSTNGQGDIQTLEVNLPIDAIQFVLGFSGSYYAWIDSVEVGVYIYGYDTIITCDSLEWNGTVYTSSTTFVDTLVNADGCDSIHMLLLTVNYSQYDTVAVTARGQYVWHDNIYTVSGTYNYYDQTDEGCDWVETLILTIDSTADVYYSVAIVVANTEGEIGVGGTVTGAGSYLAGTEVTLTATPDEGYLFNGWYTRSAMGFGGQLIVADSIYTFTLDSNVVVVAMFERIGSNSALLTVSVDSTMGYVLFNGERAPFNVYRGTLGDTVTLEAVPMAGNCVFVGWVNAEGDTLSHDATYDYVLDRTTTTLTAAFVRNEGINNVDATSVTIFTRENGVVVRGAAQAEVYVFDVVGRMVGHVSAANDEEFIRLPQTGVFLVKVGNLPARRVVVRQ